MIAKRSWINSSKFNQQPNKEAAIKVLHAFYDNGTERTTMSSEISKRLNLICWSFTAILSRSGLQFTPPIWSNPLTNVIKRKAKPKAEFPTEQSLNTFIGIQAMSYNERNAFQSNPQRLWSGSGYFRILLWLNKRLKNQSTRKIYLHIKFDSFQ